MNAQISVRGAAKRFGAFQALQDVSLDVRPGELLALLGPSGSGKTTLLRIIAGLEHPEAGQVLFAGENVRDSHVRDRRVGFVFQHYALFRHMTVFENVAFGLRVRPRQSRPARAEIVARVERLLDLVQLGGLAGRHPAALSGGQRQRVALARALAIEPQVLLLDEPFGALDAKVRKELRRWLRELHHQMAVTTVFVTHDQEEALELADRVVVMANGRIEQVGTPADVYAQPASPFVHEFLGDTNRLECRIDTGRVLLADGTVLGRSEAANGSAVLYVRPQDVVLTSGPDGAALVHQAHTAGPIARVAVAVGAATLEAAMPAEAWQTLGLATGSRVAVALRGGVVFPLQTTHGTPLLAQHGAGPMLSLGRDTGPSGAPGIGLPIVHSLGPG